MKNQAKILVVDDEQAILRMLRVALTTHDYRVVDATSVRTAIPMFALEKPDVAIIDLTLPDGSGFDIVKQVREWTDVPIIILTATADASTKISVLDFGADDYIVKPFDMNELLARIRVLLRRTSGLQLNPVIRTGQLQIDLASRVVTVSGKEVHLTVTEYNVLSELAKNAGKVITNTAMLKLLRGTGVNDDVSYLRVFIGQLRKKIEPNRSTPTYIRTEIGVGYRLAVLPVEA